MPSGLKGHAATRAVALHHVDDVEWEFDFDWRAVVAETNNEYVYASKELTLSDPDPSFSFLASSSREADVFIQVNGSALGRYDRVPSDSSLYDKA